MFTQIKQRENVEMAKLKKENLLVSIPVDLKEFIRAASELEGIPMGQYIVRALRLARKEEEAK